MFAGVVFGGFGGLGALLALVRFFYGLWVCAGVCWFLFIWAGLDTLLGVGVGWVGGLCLWVLVVGVDGVWC